ncbi:MAG: YybH family protein [Hyphococcus sp.]
MKHFLTAALVITFCTVGIASAEESRPPFRPALDAHLAAIVTKDIDAYKPTVTKGADLHIIFPGGEVMDTTEAVIAFHEEWFQDTNWRWDGEVLKVIEGEDLSAAFIKYDYRDTPEGAPRSAWLLMLFALEDGEWRLVHDQNTRVPAPTEKESD